MTESNAQPGTDGTSKKHRKIAVRQVRMEKDGTGARRGNITVSLDDNKELFSERAQQICGSPSALLQAFARATLHRRPEEVWRFCFNVPAEPADAGKLPILGRMPGGELAALIEEPMGYLHPGELRHGPNAFFVKIDGDSMLDAINGVHDGDYVLLDPDYDVQPGQMAGIIVNGQCTLKEYHPQDDGTVILKPKNPAYQPIVVLKSDIQELYAYRGLVRPPQAH